VIYLSTDVICAYTTSVIEPM